MNSCSNWLIQILINGCFHNGPVICSRSVIMALWWLYWLSALPRAITAILGHCLGPLQPSSAIASGHYSHPRPLPRAIITDLEHITGPIWKHPFINTIVMNNIWWSQSQQIYFQTTNYVSFWKINHKLILYQSKGKSN